MPGGRVEVEVVPDLRDFPGKLSSGLKGASGIASTLGKGLGLAVAAGTAVAAVGLKSVITLGNEYVGNLNELQAVTSATGFTMARVGDLAKELGADMSLPATSAADAAAAMKELAKGGLSVDQAMTAAKGTLQLAAAAQVDAAQAAEIQSDALNQFGLAAEQASHVADILANTANAASGEVTDIANALKYVGPVAKAVGADIDSVATAIGLIATQGIRGEQAGTSLRGMIASLSAPSGPAAKALRELGIEAFTAEGKFVGLRSITEQLAAAKGRLTEAEFTAAAAVAFGNEGMTVASALASTGAQAFDDMAVSVGRAGGAADVAAAKTQGLGGAWEGLVSQAETAAIEIFEVIDGPLERLVRSAADHMADIGEGVARGLEVAIATGEVYGPRLAEAIRSRASAVAQAGRDVLLPLAQGAVDPLNEAVNTGIGLWDNLTGALDNTVDAARPVATEIGELTSQSAEGSGAVGTLSTVVGGLGDTVEGLSSVLVPVGQLLGGAIGLFNDLPGPVQTAALALVAFRLAQGKLSSFDPGGLRQFTGEMRVQRELARANGEEISRLGSVMAAYRTSTLPAVAATRDLTDQVGAVRAGAAAVGEPIGRMSALLGTLAERSPAIGAIRDSFDQAAGGATRFSTAAGVAAASGTALRVGAGALVSALGGPVGLAIGAAAVGLALLSGRQQDAAQSAAEHKSRVDGLASALRESNGVVNESIRAHQAQAIQATKVGDSEKSVADAAREAGINLSVLTDATLGNGKALDGLREKLRATAEANKEFATLEDGSTAWTGRYNEQGQAALDLLGSIDGLASGFQEAQKKERELDQAIRDGRASMLDASDSGRSLASAMGILSDRTSSADSKARALNDALIALSGGSVTLEASQFRVAEVTDRLGDIFAANGTEAEKLAARTKGYGEALLNADGSLSSATENGRSLRSALQDLTTASAEVAQKTFAMSRSQGEDIPTATAKAVAAVQKSRDEFVGMAKDLGISAEQAEILADRAGLIPANVAIAVNTPGSDRTRQELAIVKGLVDAVPPGKDIHMKTISAEAEQKLKDLGFTVEHMPDGTVTIHGNTDPARTSLDEFLREPATKVVTLAWRDPGMPGSPRLGQPNLAVHDGAYLKTFAAGGFQRLNPMAAGIASIVPPNTWRVVGDRLRDDEAYIPINRSMRSQQILARTASEMGFDLIRRFAIGGIASGGSSTQAALSAPFTPAPFVGTLVLEDGTLMGRVRGVVQQELNESGTALSRGRRS